MINDPTIQELCFSSTTTVSEAARQNTTPSVFLAATSPLFRRRWWWARFAEEESLVNSPRSPVDEGEGDERAAAVCLSLWRIGGSPPQTTSTNMCIVCLQKFDHFYMPHVRSVSKSYSHFFLGSCTSISKFAKNYSVICQKGGFCQDSWEYFVKIWVLVIFGKFAYTGNFE